MPEIEVRAFPDNERYTKISIVVEETVFWLKIIKELDVIPK